MSHILLADDDRELCDLLRQYLEAEGFTVDIANDGEAAVAKTLAGGYAALILDVMMPRLNGFDALRQIRAQSNVPVIMLTARGEDIDRIVGLEMGADDYLPKPFNPRELAARLRAILRRGAAATAPDLVEVGDISLHAGDRTVLRDGRPVDLTGAEFSLLETMLRAAGQIVSKETLTDQGLGRKLQAYDRAVDTHVSSLRRKLGPDAAGNPRIKTVRGRGYVFVHE